MLAHSPNLWLQTTHKKYHRGLRRLWCVAVVISVLFAETVFSRFTFDVLFRSFSTDGYTIPRLIWQTAETFELPQPIQASMSTWRTLNDDWVITMFDDKAADSFMSKNFDARTYAVYSKLPIGVMQVRSLLPYLYTLHIPLLF